MNRILLGFALGLLAGLGLGWAFGSSSADPAGSSPADTPAEHRSSSLRLPDAGPATGSGLGPAGLARPESELAAPAPAGIPGRALEHVLAEAVGCSHEDHERARHPEELAASFAGDPELLAAAAARLADAPLEELELLVVALGQQRHPLVEDAAAALALSLAEPARRALALELLGRLRTPRALPVVQEVLARESQTSVLAAALHALPRPTGVAQGTAELLQTELEELALGSAEPELRRRALIAYADWGADPALLASALRDDPDPSVRAGAAFALERLGGGGPAEWELLGSLLNDPREDPTLRENAWRALGAAGPLPEHLARAWQEFARSRDALELDTP